VPDRPTTFASKLVPNTHVIGDACLGAAFRSPIRSERSGQGLRRVIVNLIADKPPKPRN